MSTLPEGLKISVSDFADQDTSRRLGEIVLDLARTMGKVFNLSILDGVTITSNYDQALLKLDRGIDGLQPLRASNDYAFGVAMTPTIMKQGKVKAHIVIHAGVLEPLLDETHLDRTDAANLIIHELGHVHDIATKELAFPGAQLHKYMKDPLDPYLFVPSEACWSEYAACRLSASTHCNVVTKYEEVLCEVLTKAKPAVDAEIASFLCRTTDIQQLLECAVIHYGALMKYAAYLIGTLNGVNQELEEVAPLATEKIKGSYFEETYVKLEIALKTMWATYGEWKNFQVYDPLIETMNFCLKNGGLHLRVLENGQVYVAVHS